MRICSRRVSLTIRRRRGDPKVCAAVRRVVVDPAAGPGAPHIAPLPGELPEGEIGPIRRARMERKRVEKEEAAAAAAERAKKAREEGPVFVNLLAPGSQEAAGGRRAGRRGTVPPIAVDLCADTPSPGTARKRASRRGSGGARGWSSRRHRIAVRWSSTRAR